MLTTLDIAAPVKGLREARERLLRPAVGFSHPLEVVKDPDLDLADKRAILSSWASDACAVEGRPGWRWLLGTDAPVPLADIVTELRRLDDLEEAGAGWFPKTPTDRPRLSA
jgi:hypothetical protein